MKSFKQFFESFAPNPMYFFHGGRDWDTIDPKKYGTGEPGGIRPLGHGLYGGVGLSDEDLPAALNLARAYANKYGGHIHGFGVNLQDPNVANIGYGGNKWARGGLGEPTKSTLMGGRNAKQLEYEVLPWQHNERNAIEGAVHDPNILSRIGKWKKDVSDEEIINTIKKLSASTK
jgi:hypothetical protein